MADGSDHEPRYLEPRKFGGLRKQCRGTPKLSIDDPKFICPYCTNTGWAERSARTEGPKWKHCPCGQRQV